MNNEEAIKEIRRLLTFYDPFQQIVYDIDGALFIEMNIDANKISGISDIIKL